jgi:hypothetical protein
MAAALGSPTTDSLSMSILPTLPAPTRWDPVSSTTTRADATAAVLGAALDEAGDVALEIAGDAGGLEAGAALLAVPAIGVLVADGEATGADVDVLACLELEVHAVANAASATSAAARR